MALSNGAQRTLFALVAAPLFVAALWAGGAWRAGLLTAILGCSTWEFARILRLKFPLVGPLPQRMLPFLACVLGILSPWGPLRQFGMFHGLLSALTVIAVLLWAFRKLGREDVFPWVVLTCGLLAYIAGWGSSFYGLSEGPRGWLALAPIMLAFGSCWTGDTAAYAVGRAIGRHKLCPELSPAKTIEGAIAGVVAPAILGYFWAPAFLDLGHLVGLVIGAGLGVAGIVGDLAESVFKRWAGVKDSSNLLPGHGGVLDRFDSAFLAAPLLHFVLIALGRA